MKSKIKYGYFIAIFLLLGCKEEEEPEITGIFPEYLVFGLFQQPGCGQSDQCVEIYKLESGSLKEDVNDEIPQAGVPYSGNFSLQHSQSDYEQIQEIFKDNIPQELLDHPSGMIGNPQPWTFQTFYFEYKKNNHKQ